MAVRYVCAPTLVGCITTFYAAPKGIGHMLTMWRLISDPFFAVSQDLLGYRGLLRWRVVFLPLKVAQ